jgi:hypothetical protein
VELIISENENLLKGVRLELLEREERLTLKCKRLLELQVPFNSMHAFYIATQLKAAGILECTNLLQKNIAESLDLSNTAHIAALERLWKLLEAPADARRRCLVTHKRMINSHPTDSGGWVPPNHRRRSMDFPSKMTMRMITR